MRVLATPNLDLRKTKVLQVVGSRLASIAKINNPSFVGAGPPLAHLHSASEHAPAGEFDELTCDYRQASLSSRRTESDSVPSTFELEPNQ